MRPTLTLNGFEIKKMENRPKTIFLDIDGTILEHKGEVFKQFTQKPKLLNGTLQTLTDWDKKGYNIILTTGRKEGMRKKTMEQLEELGIFYDQLIMGIGGGVRILINDRKPNSEEDTAYAYNLTRNEGINKLNII